MSDPSASTLAGTRVLVCDAEGSMLGSPADAVDLIGAAGALGAELVLVPLTRLDPAFFELANRSAGEFLQKLVNYGLRLAVVGDVGPYVEHSKALADFVRESNRGRQIWFVRDAAELEGRLGRS
ncbi:MAG: DUF4180 domain-containing protein [Pseudomonadales bacterium]